VGAVETIGLFAAGGCAGAVNAVAGGGSLVTFPALLAFGYSPLAMPIAFLVPAFIRRRERASAVAAGSRARRSRS